MNLFIRCFFPFKWTIHTTLSSLIYSQELHSFEPNFQNPCIPGAFFLYTGLAMLGLIFVLGCLPETKGLQLEEIENLFAGQLCSCGEPSPNSNRHVQYIRVKGSNYLPSDNDASDVE